MHARARQLQMSQLILSLIPDSNYKYKIINGMIGHVALLIELQ